MKNKKPVPAIRNEILFLATTTLFFIAMSITGCSNASSSQAKESNISKPVPAETATEQTKAFIVAEIEAQSQIQPTLSVAWVHDFSISFKDEVERISPELLSPIYRFFKERPGSERMLFSVVTANSNTLLSRFTSLANKVDTATTTQAKNSWISSEQPKPKYTIADVNNAIDEVNNSNWQKFCKEVIGRTSGDLAKKSDVSNAINRALMGLAEQPTARKWLIISTDFLDDYNSHFAQIPCDVKIIVVGANVKAPLNEMLGTSDYLRFESISAAFEFLSHVK